MTLYSYNGRAGTAHTKEGTAADCGYGMSGGAVFTIMSYNVGAWYYNGYEMPSALYTQYYNLQKSIFYKYQPDFVGIQEYFSAIGDKSAEEFLADYFVSSFTVDRYPTAGRAIASKYEITDITDNPYTEQYGEQRYYIKGYITVDDKRICVISTHLCHLGEYMYPQAAELAAIAAQEEYCIIAGDFNADINTEAGYAGIVKPFTDAGLVAANGGEFGVINTHHDTETGGWRAIDAIFVTPNIKLVSVFADQTKVTDDIDMTIDHVPLVAHVLID